MEALRLVSLVDDLDGSRMEGTVRAYVEASDEVIRDPDIPSAGVAAAEALPEGTSALTADQNEEEAPSAA